MTKLETENHEQKQEDTQSIIANRLEKLSAWRKETKAFPTDFRRTVWSIDIHKQFDTMDAETLDAAKNPVKVAGRIMTKRVMGKASFVHIQDMHGMMQLYIRQDDIGMEAYEAFKHLDLGDIIGAEGTVFRTKTNELSVKVNKYLLLTKSIRPLPDKFHGLADQEMRYRKRYLDLIANAESRHVFKTRARVVEIIRHYLHKLEFLEVETPMMQVLAGGAAARPFTTHHHALDLPLYLRIAPELYLKRLVVGGFERVFEINRNFRNEGLSTQHNPEFTMLEFYQAYADYHDLMDLTEDLFEKIAVELFGVPTFTYLGHTFDFGKPFLRLSMFAAILHYNEGLVAEDLKTLERARRTANQLNVPIDEKASLAKVQLEIFEKTVEHKLIEPTFITEYPAEVSPLARRNDEHPEITDRFELFIAGREIANGFCELNDPEDQALRFQEQMQQKATGDHEAMPYDHDYIMALEHGLPPTAGEGIGIDRLVMLFTNAASIRDVILFPHMRPKDPASME